LIKPLIAGCLRKNRPLLGNGTLPTVNGHRKRGTNIQKPDVQTPLFCVNFSSFAAEENPVFKSQVGRKILPYVGAFISLIIVCAALWVMNNTLRSIQISDVIDQLKEISATSLILALLITCVSYWIVTGYDVVALDHVRRRVPYSRAALSAFLASTFGNNIGFAILTGTSIRYRVYSQVGLSAMDIAGVSTMCALTTTLGMSVIFAVAMVLQTGDVATTGIPIPPAYMRFVGASVLAVIIGYLIVSSLRPLSIRTKSWSLRLPNSKTTILQILLATTNLSLVATLIYVLLPDSTDVSYIAFLSVFALALIAGSASNVPGGIGVFESVILVGLPEIPPRTARFHSAFSLHLLSVAAGGGVYPARL